VALVTTSCQQGGGEGPGRRAQRLALTPDQELDLGTKAYKEVLSKSRPLPGSSPQVERVRRVGERIVKAAQIEPLRREINLHIQDDKLAWEFNVLDNKQVNAFCLPGGKVAVFTGLLPVADDDDELATVMSHEIAHALAHHASERIAREQMLERAASVIGGTMGSVNEEDRRKLVGLLGAGAQIGSLAYDRKQESEADHIGLFLMTFAGYQPEQALMFWQKMQKLSAQHGHPPAILSDHPSDERRIEDLKKEIGMAKAAKKAFDEGRIAPSR
jgi:predicted Zn-dependent protease